MNRRDFLLLRRDPRRLEPEPRELELSCRQLYMQCLDTQMTGVHPEDPAESAEPSPWFGEPPARFVERSRQQIFEDLERELREVEIVRVVDSQWLVGDLRRDFDNLMDRFRARGGRVRT